MIVLRIFLLVAALEILLSCARTPEGPRQHFRDLEELSTIQITREGLAFLSQNRFAEAEMRFRQALYRQPDLDNLKRNLSAALEGTEDYEGAEKILAEISAGKDTDKQDTLLRLAHLKVSKRDFLEADKIYRQVFDRSLVEKDYPLAIRALRNLKILAYKIGREDDASCFAEAIFSLSQDVDSLVEWGKMLIALGNFESAVDVLDRYSLSRGFQRDPRVLHLQAVAFFALGEYRKAWDLEDRGIKIARIDAGLLREMDVVRILTSTDPAVIGDVTEDTRDALEKSWEDMAESYDLTQKEYLTMPLPLLEAFLAKKG